MSVALALKAATDDELVDELRRRLRRRFAETAPPAQPVRSEAFENVREEAEVIIRQRWPSTAGLARR